MTTFSGPVEARARVLAEVEHLLALVGSGTAPPRTETAGVDLKEEPGRRDRDGALLPGDTRNHEAASLLARAACCMANTPGGGAVVIGVEDATWQVLGTALDEEWLRQRVYQLVDLAPDVTPRTVAGQRILVALVAEAPEPVEDLDGKIRWRVGDSCVPVDRAEWWLHRQARAGHDPMAARTTRTVADVTAGSLVVARRFLRHEDPQAAPDGEPPHLLLRRLGVLSDDALTQAGALAFTAAGRSLVTLARRDVPGGEVLTSYDPPGHLSLLEQVAEAEARLDAFNPVVVVRRGLAEPRMRALPPRAIREAVLNGLIHRDWNRHEPTALVWIDADARLEVLSPGGFTGGVTAQTVLSRRHARYPALSDLLRTLRLVDRQGIGVDRMYREMIALGHRPPAIDELPGPAVRTVLAGGRPAIPVLDLVAALRPQVRQRDVAVALLIHELLHRPFVDLPAVARALQDTDDTARFALRSAGQTTVRDEPLVRPYKDVWLLGRSAVALVEAAGGGRGALAARGLLTYRRASGPAAESVVRAWLACHDQITSGDFAEITGTATSNASRSLAGMTGGLLARGAASRGRNAHFVAGPPLAV